MTIFTDIELAGLRSAQELHMQDTCQVGVRSTSPDAFGELIETYTYGAPIACGLGPSRTFLSESVNADATIVQDDRTIRLPTGTVVTSTSLIKVTHRFGTKLVSPEVYGVQGTPFEGPSGIEANCRRVMT